MSFDPADFYKLAQGLLQQANDDDASLRSAISRAYYGALITARDSAGLSTVGQNTHSNVISHYRTNAAGQLVADNLKKLKELRERADYQPKALCSRTDGHTALSLSRKLLGGFNALKPNPPPTPGSANPPTTR